MRVLTSLLEPFKKFQSQYFSFFTHIFIIHAHIGTHKNRWTVTIYLTKTDAFKIARFLRGFFCQDTCSRCCGSMSVSFLTPGPWCYQVQLSNDQIKLHQAKKKRSDLGSEGLISGPCHQIETHRVLWQSWFPVRHKGAQCHPGTPATIRLLNWPPAWLEGRSEEGLWASTIFIWLTQFKWITPALWR